MKANYGRASQRRGSMVVLVAISLVAVVSLSAFAVNLSYMELCRTETRLVSDAAAKAAVATLGVTQSVEAASVAAQRVAQLHTVAGKNFSLRSSDIEFGNCKSDEKGELQFDSQRTPVNAVRVNCGKSMSYASPLLTGSFDISNSSTATRVDNDICLVIDRSASMSWDMSNQEFSYPAEQRGKSRLQNYYTKPNTNGSRWQAVQDVIAVFNSIVGNSETKVGLVTFSSDYKFGVYESQRATTDIDLNTKTSLVIQKLQQLGQSPLIGDTNIEAGLSEGVRLLRDSSSCRRTAYKTIVLLSDGRQTEGGDPILVARAAYAANITVHTVAFSAQADPSLMREIAKAGGGTSQAAEDVETLRIAFRKIAESIPSIIAQ